MGAWGRRAAIQVAAGLMVAVAALIPVAMAAGSPLDVIGVGAQNVLVSLAAHTDGELTATSDIPLSNGTKSPVRITARFFPAGSLRPVTVSASSQPVSIAKTVSIPAGGSAVLPLDAHLTSPEQPSDLNGTLVLQEKNKQGRTVGELQLAVTGALSVPTDVAFEPSEVTLQVTRWQNFSTAAGDHLHIRLRGPGVARLVAAVGALTGSEKKPQPAATVLLGSDGGKQTLVVLSDLKLVQPGLADATITTEESVVCKNGDAVDCGHGPPSPGSYTGTLTLSGLGDGPTLKVTVNSRFWFPVPVALVLLGALLGGLLPLLTANGQTRRQLKTNVRQALDDYRRVRDVSGSDAVWDLSLGDDRTWFQKHHVGPPGDMSVAAVWTNIHSARSDSDLAQASDAVAGLTERITAWEEAAPLAAALEKLRANPPQAPLARPWRDMQVRKDTDMLLLEVKGLSSPSAQDAPAYTQRLRRQLRFHEEYARVWERRQHLGSLYTNDEADALGDPDLVAFDEQVKAAPPEPKRQASDMAALEVALADIGAAVDQLIAAKEHVPEEVPLESLTSEERVEVVAQLTDHRRAPAEVAQILGVSAAAVTAVSADLPETTAALTPPPPPPADTSRRPRQQGPLQWVWGQLVDWSLFIAITIVTAVAYMIPLYSNTWGGWEDWLAAFAAGVVGQVGIKWAVLPALRSAHLPAGSAAAADGGS